jgi:hypothetical protein
VWEMIGAGAFGFVLGWNVYFVNRYRTDQVALANLTSLAGVLGGGTVLALFPAGSKLFGAYGIGLALGFLSYLTVLLLMVAKSRKFGIEWFLDGRRKQLEPGEYIPEATRSTGTPMSPRDSGLPK